jgi:amino acid adenylation domain-containing protein
MGQKDVYHIPGILRIQGNLDLVALKSSFDYLFSRHESLRTSFRKNDSGKVYQHISETSTIDIIQEDLTSLSVYEQEIKSKSLCNTFIRAPFDLLSDPLFRVLLIHLSSDEYILGLCFHHIISDGWSMNILIKELNICYQLYSKGEEPYLESLSIQYADYSVWQRSLFASDQYSTSLDHCVTHLSGYENLAIPLDHPRPKYPSGRGSQVSFELSSTEKEALLNLSRTSGGTLFTILLTSVYIVLHKYSGQDDLCIGIPVANRSHNDVEGLIGFFVNTLVNRLHIEETDSLQDIFSKVQEELLRSQKHQHIPFDKLVEALQPERDTSMTPIFQVMVNYVVMENSLSLGDTKLHLEPVDYNISRFDVAFDFSDTSDGGLRVMLEYNTDIYTSETADRLINSLEYILKSLPNEFSTLLSTYSVLRPEEEHQLLVDFNDTKVEYPKDRCIHELFEDQASRTPDAIAVMYADTELTYRELEVRSKQVAIYLQQQGVTPETLVGICMDRSLEMIVGILGILRSGGAYVPIDPDYPKDRISYMIDDSICIGNKEEAPNIILCQDNLKEMLEDIISEFSIELLSLSSVWEENDLIINATGNLTRSVCASNLAYVIYTSGTTGKPKGVMIEHRGVCNYLLSQNKFLGTPKEKRFYLLHSYAFDTSISCLFGALCFSNTIVITKTEDKLSSKVYNLYSIDIAYIPPSLLNLMDKNDLHSLETIIVSGELSSSEILNKFLDKSLINEYGPTEATVGTTYNKLNVHSNVNVIGALVDNKKAYILDTSMNLVPIGVIGELYIGGSGLARGYLNRPDLTAERFIDNPFGEGKLYKTGDLARWLADGNLEFIGRNDDQVKIRGFRIELGEIESTVASHPDVEGCVVVSKDQGAGVQLIAYYVLDEGSNTVDSSILREYLSDRLPDYMIPAFIERIDEIPLTPNGKIDRKYLLSIDIEISGSKEYIAARTDIEQQLVSIWEEVLQVDKVGINDDFFDLGGHSLLAVQVVQKIKNILPDSLMDLKDFMSAITIENQAKLLENSKEESVNPHLILFNKPSDSATTDISTFIIPGMPGIVDGYFELAEELATDKKSVYGIQMQGIVGESLPLESIKEIAARNIRMIKEVSPDRIQLVAHSYGGLVVYEMLKQLYEANVKVEEVILIDSYATIQKTKLIDRVEFFIRGIIESSNIIMDDKEIANLSQKTVNTTKKNRVQFLHKKLIDKGLKVDKTFLTNIYRLYTTSMNIKYMPDEVIDYKVTLINAQKAHDDHKDLSLGWSKYYTSVAVVQSSADHFGVLKTPFVSQWIKEIENTKIK